MTSVDEGRKPQQPTELHSHGKAGREKAEQLLTVVTPTPAAITQAGGMHWEVESTLCC